MRALLCEGFGGPGALRVAEAPEPEPGPGEVLLAVHRAAVNFPDLLMSEGKYQIKPPSPFSPGIEAAGVVRALGPGVTGFSVGQRAMARLDWGGFAEAVAAPASRLVAMPDGMGFDEAAGFLVSYGTTHYALADRGALTAGEVLLVLGATGGVGLTAVELGRAMGAIVIAAGGSDEKLDAARRRGADYTVNYRREDVRGRVKAVTGGAGADVVYDPVGGDAADAAVRSLAVRGRFLVIGFASGRVPEIPANRLLIKDASAVGVLWGLHAARHPEAANDVHRRLVALHAHGRLKPLVSSVVPLEQAPAAVAALAERTVVGRTVIQIQD